MIVSWHWGISPVSGGKGELVSYQTELTHACIEAGADLVVGHHPHLLQGVEVSRGKAIFYSLGDFTPRIARSNGSQSTIAVSMRVSGRQAQEVSFIPGEINERDQPRFLIGTEAEAIANVQAASTPFGTCFRVESDGVAIEATPAGEPVNAAR